MFWRRFGDEEGAIIVLFALVFVFILGLVAIVVDAGIVYLNRAQLQKAVDAAALAGGQRLPSQTDAEGAALQYSSMNGIKSSDTLRITFPNRRVRVRAERDVRLYFAPILGIETMHVTAQAAAAFVANRVFDFALFSGGRDQDLNYSGSSLLVQGDCHSNRNSKFSGSSMVINGAMDVVGTFRRSGSSINVGAIYERSKYLDMPDFSDQVRGKTTNVYGNGHVFGSNVDVDGNIVVNGSMHMNGSTINGNGVVLAQSDIHINGSSIRYATTDDAVVIYSENGEIHINGSNIDIYGILYAPNGLVQLNGSNIRVHGAVIANEIKLSGSKFEIIHDPDATQALPDGFVSLVE